MPPEAGVMPLFEALRSHILVLPNLVKFAVIMAAIVGIPALTRRLKLLGMIGLWFFDVLMGPHALGFFGQYRPIADFFGELGKLLLMFSAGLEVDIHRFRQAQTRSLHYQSPARAAGGR